MKAVLAGTTALITGAGSGIGRAIALRLGGCGAEVVITGRRIQLLRETAAAVGGAGGRAFAHSCDLTNDDALCELIRVVNDVGGGRLAVLIHCAAEHAVMSVERTSPEIFDAILKSNLRAPFMLTRSLLPSLRRAKGDIVFVNSSAVLKPRADLSAYTVSKAALKAFADCLRVEVNADGIRVLSVFPGRTATPMQEGLFVKEGRKYPGDFLLQPEEIASVIVDALLLARTAELTELHIRPTLDYDPRNPIK